MEDLDNDEGKATEELEDEVKPNGEIGKDGGADLKKKKK